MIVCPVCEHPQQASPECELCGRRFGNATAPVADVAPMEGLEPTLHADVLAPLEPATAMQDLEPTSAGPVYAPEVVTPDVEPTSAAPVEVQSVAIPDIERIRDSIPTDEPTALPLAPVCRYCQTPAVPGEKLCSRCGMRLPVIDPNLIPAGNDQLVLCSNCGSVSTRLLCPACGSRRSQGAPE